MSREQALGPSSQAHLDYRHASGRYGPPANLSRIKPTERDEVSMTKLVLNVAGALAVLMGTIWVLQGVSVLPGSFMSGQIRWAVYGAIAIVLGVLTLRRANRPSRA